MLFFLNDGDIKFSLVEILRRNYTSDGAYYKAIMKSKTICKTRYVDDKTTITPASFTPYHY